MSGRPLGRFAVRSTGWMLAGTLLFRTAVVPPESHRSLWGVTGHHIVARLAYTLLTPAARRAVKSLLQGQGFATISTWADEIRDARPETKPLHFVNIPAQAAAYDSARDCKGGKCVVWAVRHYQAVLADTSAARKTRAEALRFLVHFVGDIHQPLHCADRNDRGGNNFPVSFFGKAEPLHAVWDDGLIDQAGMSENRYVTSLRQRMAQMDTAAIAGGSPEEWADQSHRLAVDEAYDGLAHGDALGEPYFDQAIGPVDDQLIRAGVRLARMLNQALR